jgi:hypothetical protein
MDVRNLLVLGSSLPAEASHPSNLATGAGSFTNAAAHNYTLVKGARAIDAGASIADVAADRQGMKRPQGSAWDVGAYEYPQVTQAPPTEKLWRDRAARDERLCDPRRVDVRAQHDSRGRRLPCTIPIWVTGRQPGPATDRHDAGWRAAPKVYLLAGFGESATRAVERTARSHHVRSPRIRWKLT